MISRSSEYAIRAATFLALQTEPRFHLARDMAQVLSIPAPFLGKVLQPLVTRGILASQRGRSGGFKLARPARDITLLEIVETQESLDQLRHCILGQADCNDERPCPLHAYWKNTSQGFLGMLANTSLQHMTDHARLHPQSSYPFPTWSHTAMPRSVAHALNENKSGGAAPRAACF
jgi:Rrf2 family protein